MSITNSRATTLLIDCNSSVPSRNRYTARRNGPRISRAKARGVGVSAKVMFMPTGEWILAPVAQDLTRIANTSSSGFSGASLGSTDFNVAPGWVFNPTHRKETDLPGVEYSGDVLPTGVSGAQRRVAAGGTFNTKLTTDQTSFPPPTLDTADVPMNRVLQGKVTYPRNTPYALTFSTPGDTAGMDTLLTFYFGGPAVTVEGGIPYAGVYALVIRGSGMAQLFEKTTATAWEKRHEFLYSANALTSNLAIHTIQIIPYGRDTIAFLCAQTDLTVGGTGLFTFPTSLVGQRMRKTCTSHYRASFSITGYRLRDHVTGPGIIRMDARQDFRSIVYLYRMKYPPDGTLIDLPIHLPYPVPGGTRMEFTTPFGQFPTGTSITATVYRADTNQPISTDGNGFWLSEALVNDYYVVMDFISDTEHTQTPVLAAYTLDVEGQTETLVGNNQVSGDHLHRISITGPDIHPDQDTASFSLEDPNYAYSIFGTRGRIPCQIRTTTAFGTDSILFQGQTAIVRRRLKGISSQTYPVANWSEWDVQMVGMWCRLADQLHVGPPIFYDHDPTAASDPIWGGKLPWKITDIITDLLYRSGFNASQVNITSNSLRLFEGSGLGPPSDEMALNPGRPYMDFARKLCTEYLGAFLIFDANAGASGQWRILTNPNPPYTAIASFVGANSVTPGRLVMEEGAAGSFTGVIIKGSYSSHVEAPEGNVMVVCGAGGTLPGDGGPQAMTAAYYNADSFNIDPANPTASSSHPDYIGYMVPLLHADPTLISKKAVQWVARRLFNFTCHARKWAEFDAPLILVNAAQTGDTAQTRPRPLRIGDGCTVLGSNAVIRTCNPFIDKDSKQFAHYEVLFA